VRRVVGFGGRVCGGKPSTNETTNKLMDGVQMGVASGWGRLSVRRGVGFGGHVKNLTLIGLSDRSVRLSLSQGERV
jgi:hypothetical protein